MVLTKQSTNKQIPSPCSDKYSHKRGLCTSYIYRERPFALLFPFAFSFPFLSFCAWARSICVRLLHFHASLSAADFCLYHARPPHTHNDSLTWTLTDRQRTEIKKPTACRDKPWTSIARVIRLSRHHQHHIVIEHFIIIHHPMTSGM